MRGVNTLDEHTLETDAAACDAAEGARAGEEGERCARGQRPGVPPLLPAGWLLLLPHGLFGVNITPSSSPGPGAKELLLARKRLAGLFPFPHLVRSTPLRVYTLLVVYQAPTVPPTVDPHTVYSLYRHAPCARRPVGLPMRDAVTRFVVSLATGRRGLNEEGGDDGGGGADGGADAARAIAEAEHRLTGFNGMLLSLILVLLIVSGVWSDRHKFPASSSSILIGAALGAIFRIVGEQESHMLSSAAGVKFDEELFLFVMLPPIIYEAGYSLPRRPFFQNFMTIFLFAIVGTLLTTFVIGKTVYSVGSTGSSPRRRGRSTRSTLRRRSTRTCSAR